MLRGHVVLDFWPCGRQATDSPNILVPTAFRLRWHRRAMYATEATGLPLSIQWYGAQICKASSGLKHDNKYCSRLCLWQAWHRLTQWNNQVMDPNHLQQYADVISAKGSPLDNCFGFVDGTVRPISRPGQHQRAVYNGHKRVHALKFQSVALPNGLIGNLYGPIGNNNYNNVWNYLCLVVTSV